MRHEVAMTRPDSPMAQLPDKRPTKIVRKIGHPRFIRNISASLRGQAVS
jgi:hypothetical protein